MITVQRVTWVVIVRHDVIPVLSGYVVFVAMLVVYARRLKAASGPRREGTSPASTLKMSLTLREASAASSRHRRRPPFRYMAGTFLGGYASFLLIVLVFYFAIGEKSPTFISQALGQGSLFAFGIVLPGYVLLSFVEQLIWRARKRRRPDKNVV